MPADPLNDPIVLREVKRAMAGAEKQTLGTVWRALRAELSLLRTLAVLAEVQAGKMRGRPFRELGKPSDVREALSRAQAGPLVLLVRAVRTRRGSEAAMRVGRAVAHEGAMGFLDRMVPSFDRATLESKPIEVADRIMGRFFNSEATVRLEGESAAIDVTRCHFAELLERIGEREVAPLMCEADISFFDGKRRLIRLGRTQTLAEGASHCDFVFRIEP